jgi:hypothetical protein
MGKLGAQPDLDQQACEEHRARRNQTQRRSGLAGALAGNKTEPELYARKDLSDGFKELEHQKRKTAVTQVSKRTEKTASSAGSQGGADENHSGKIEDSSGNKNNT